MDSKEAGLDNLDDVKKAVNILSSFSENVLLFTFRPQGDVF